MSIKKYIVAIAFMAISCFGAYAQHGTDVAALPQPEASFKAEFDKQEYQDPVRLILVVTLPGDAKPTKARVNMCFRRFTENCWCKDYKLQPGVNRLVINGVKKLPDYMYVADITVNGETVIATCTIKRSKFL